MRLFCAFICVIYIYIYIIFWSKHWPWVTRSPINHSRFKCIFLSDSLALSWQTTKKRPANRKILQHQRKRRNKAKIDSRKRTNKLQTEGFVTFREMKNDLPICNLKIFLIYWFFSELNQNEFKRETLICRKGERLEFLPKRSACVGL